MTAFLPPLYVLSCLSLIFVVCMCAVGLISTTYRDNVAQCLAMFVLMVGAASRVPDVWARASVPPDWFMVHLGLALFAFGTWQKVRRAQLRRRRVLASLNVPLSTNEEGWASILPEGVPFGRRSGDPLPF